MTQFEIPDCFWSHGLPHMWMCIARTAFVVTKHGMYIVQGYCLVPMVFALVTCLICIWCQKIQTCWSLQVVRGDGIWASGCTGSMPCHWVSDQCAISCQCTMCTVGYRPRHTCH